MTRQVLNRGTIANDGTGDTLRTASLKIEQNIQELYAKLGDGNSLAPLLDFDSSGIIFEGSVQNSFETTLRVRNPTADRAVFIPNYGGNLVMDSATQTLTNKTITSPVLTTPQINDTSADHQYVIAVSELAADRIVTLPLLGAGDTLVFNNHTAVLKNKTLQSPQLNNPKIGSQILDSAGNELLKFQDSSNAVNYILVANSSGTNPAVVKATGATNTSLSLQATGLGGIKIDSRLVLTTQGLTSTGAIDVTKPVSLLTGTTGTHALPNGVGGQNGEVKHIVNMGSGVQTVTETSGNGQGFASLAIPQNGAVTLIWFGTAWLIVSHYLVVIT